VRGISLAQGRWPTGGHRNDARRAAGQRAGAEARGRRRGWLTRRPGRAGRAGAAGRWGRVEGKYPKIKAQIQKSKIGTSWAPKFTKFLPKQDHTTKNIMQQQTLKNPLSIAHNNSSKIAVF
jgi:hypothetical protein